MMKDLLSLPPVCWDAKRLTHVLHIYIGFRAALGQETSGQVAAAGEGRYKKGFRKGRENPVRHGGHRSGVPEHSGVYVRED